MKLTIGWDLQSTVEAHLNLVGYNFAPADRCAYFIDTASVKINETKSTDRELTLSLDVDEMAKDGEIAWIIVGLPMDLQDVNAVA
jgi:hypothetical protein